MDIKDLRRKELSNLYAIFKQSNKHFKKAGISFLTDKKQLMLTYYIKFTADLEEKVSDICSKLGINPGNTKDSIVEEMTENLKESMKLKIDQEVKEIGYLMSVNRLMNYQISNLENIAFFRSDEEDFEELLSLTQEFKNIQQSIF